MKEDTSSKLLVPPDKYSVITLVGEYFHHSSCATTARGSQRLLTLFSGCCHHTLTFNTGSSIRFLSSHQLEFKMIFYDTLYVSFKKQTLFWFYAHILRCMHY